MSGKSEFSSYRWWILFSACFAMLSVYIEMIAVAPIVGEIAADLRVEVGTTTNLMMAFVLSASCVLIWGGFIVDKFGLTVATVLGLLCAAVPAGLMPIIGHNFGTVFIARLVQGASSGLVLSTIGPVAVSWFPPKEHGLAGGAMIALIPVGSALGGLLSPMIVSAGVSWQGAVSILGLLGWISIVLALIIMRRPAPRRRAEVVQPIAGQLTLRHALRFPMTWIGAIVLFFSTWNLYCFLNLVPPFIALPSPMGIGLGSVTAGKLALAGTIIGVFSTFLGGPVFDRVAKGNQRHAVLSGFALAGLFAFALSLTAVHSNTALLIVCLVLVGWGVNFMGPSFNGFIAANYPPQIVGRMVGWWFGIGGLGGALGLYVGGKTVAATGSFKTAILLVSVSSLVGFVLDLFLRPAKKYSP